MKAKPKNKLSLSDCINLTEAKSVARTTHDGLSAENKSPAASEEINKTLKTKINKEVKNTLLDIAHQKLDLLNCEHLTKSVSPMTKMVHPLKPTLEQLVGTHHALKVS